MTKETIKTIFESGIDWKDFDTFFELFNVTGVTSFSDGKYANADVKSWVDKRAKEAIKASLITILKSCEKAEITRANQGYDGNDINSARKKHGIGALNWTEILRFEDGQNKIIQDSNNQITSLIEEIEKI